MSNTVWTKKAREGFNMDSLSGKDKSTGSDQSAKLFGGDKSTGSDQSAKLFGGETPTDLPNKYKPGNIENIQREPDIKKNKPIDKIKTADYGNSDLDTDSSKQDVLLGYAQVVQESSDVPKDEKEKDIRMKDKINDLFKKFDLTKAKNLYKEMLGSFGDIFKDFHEKIEMLFMYIFGSYVNTPETRSDIKVVAYQISRWIKVIPMTYIVLVNWWYITCYTTFSFDFRQLIWGPSKWIMSGPLSALEFLNYYMLTYRLESNRSAFKPDALRSIWGWRPITFTICHLLIVAILETVDIADLITNFMGATGLGYAMVLALSVFYFATLMVREVWFEPAFRSSMMVAVAVMVGLIMSFIIMFMFVSLVCPLFSMYLIFISYFAIFAFHWFWPPSIFASINQIFQELREAYVQDPVDKMGKIWKSVFNNFHTIYLFILMSTIFIIHIKQVFEFKSSFTIMLGFVINILVCIIIAPSGISKIGEILSILTDGSEEQPMPNPVEKEF